METQDITLKAQDTSAFTNAAYSIQGDNQENIEYGAIIFKGLNMTIVPYSNSEIELPQHIQRGTV